MLRLQRIELGWNALEAQYVGRNYASLPLALEAQNMGNSAANLHIIQFKYRQEGNRNE